MLKWQGYGEEKGGEGRALEINTHGYNRIQGISQAIQIEAQNKLKHILIKAQGRAQFAESVQITRLKKTM